MNATMVASGTKAVPHVVSSIQDIPLAKIRESKTNPRRVFDDTKLAELAENIRQHGVLQPILVRPLPEGEAGMYELVAGARRFRASKIAKRESIPATVRELTDAQALELQVIENVQRVDVHPLDEAQGYAALIQLQPNTYTVESIASRVGRSAAYVSGRLRLIQLIPEAKQAFYEDKLTVAHAFEVARLQPNDQRRALQECFPHHRNAGAILKDKRAEAVTVRELRGWVAREIHLDLTNAPFDPQDEKLLPAAGACSRCPKQTGSNPLLFPEIPRRASICTDRECYRAKVQALVQIQVKPLADKGEKPLRVSQALSWQANGHAKDVLFEGQYRRAKAKGECPNTKSAVLIEAIVIGLVRVGNDEMRFAGDLQPVRVARRLESLRGDAAEQRVHAVRRAVENVADPGHRSEDRIEAPRAEVIVGAVDVLPAARWGLVDADRRLRRDAVVRERIDWNGERSKYRKRNERDPRPDL